MKPDLQGLLVEEEKMEKEATTARSGHEDSPVNLDPAVCWDPRDPKAPLDHLVSPVWMATQDLKETLDLKESPAPTDNKATPELRDSQGPREPSGPQERRDL